MQNVTAIANKKEWNLRLNILFLIIPFFRPDCIELAGQTLDMAFIVWRVLAFLLAAYYYFRRFALNKSILLILLYEIIQIYASIFNNVSISTKIINIANFVALYMIFSFFSQENSREFINVTYKWLSCLIYMNAILTILFPNGLNRVASDSGRINFLGKDNTITLYFILMIAFCVLYQNIRPKSKSPFFTVLIVICTELFYKSGSGLIVIFIISAYLLFFARNKFVCKLANARLLLFLYVGFEIVIVMMNRIQNLEFVFSILGKSATFSDRRYYWDQAIKQFLSSPIWGQGGGTVELWDNGYYSHNALLDVLLKGGIAAAMVWIVLLYVCMKMGGFKRNRFIQGFFRILMFSALIYGLMEGLEDRIAFNALLSLMFVLPELEKHECLQNILLKIPITGRNRESIRKNEGNTENSEKCRE